LPINCRGYAVCPVPVYGVYTVFETALFGALRADTMGLL